MPELEASCRKVLHDCEQESERTLNPMEIAMWSFAARKLRAALNAADIVVTAYRAEGTPNV